MADFHVIEKQGLKMIKAVLSNETVRAEAGALHYMIGAIEMESKAPSVGGFLKSMATQESAFKPTYKGTGDVFFGPPIYGEYMQLELNNEAWILDKGAFVCCDMGIEVGAFRNKAVTGLVGGEGFFQTKVEGTGKVIIQAPGPLEVVDLQNNTLTVDGSFAVARQAHLNYAVKRASKSLLGSMTSGEGLVNVISGSGRVYIAPVPNLYRSLVDAIIGPLAMMRSKG